MSAPWCVKLKKNILVIVDNELLVSVGHDDGDRTFLSLGNGFRLDARVNLAIKNVLNERANLLGGNILGLVPRELGVLLGPE